jgi:hypothetical protein
MSEEHKERRPPAEREPSQETVQASEQGAREAAGLAAEGVRAGMATVGNGAGLGPLSAGVADVSSSLSSADITDELDKAGPAFGAFVKGIGLAVAEAQQKLDETLVNTAKALSDTQIDVIAVFEQQINDEDGSMSAGVPHVQKLPLVNYLMPTAYQWSRVYLESDMKVSEFSASNGFNIQGKSQNFQAGVSGSYGMFGGSIKGSVSYGLNAYDAAGNTASAQDSAAGNMHMEATLEPRGDIKLPQPFITQKGPSLKVTVDTVEAIETDVPGANGGAATKQRTGTKATLTATLLKSNGDPHSGKQLEISVSQPTVTYAMTNGGKTGNDGTVKITLTREGAAFVDGQALQTIARLWFGLVVQTVPVNL